MREALATPINRIMRISHERLPWAKVESLRASSAHVECEWSSNTRRDLGVSSYDFARSWCILKIKPFHSGLPELSMHVMNDSRVSRGLFGHRVTAREILFVPLLRRKKFAWFCSSSYCSYVIFDSSKSCLWFSVIIRQRVSIYGIIV